MEFNPTKPLLALITASLIALTMVYAGLIFAQQNSNASATRSKLSILDEISQRGYIKVGTTGDFKPFSYVNSDKVRQGVDIELAKNLAKSLDVNIKFIDTSWPTLMSDLMTNKFDIAMSGITIKLSRQKYALFSDATMSSGKAAIARIEDVERFTTIEKINTPGTRVIVNPGGTNESFAKEHFPKATIIVNEDNLTVFDKIVAKDADVMVTDAIETLIQEQIHPELKAVNSDQPFNWFEFGYMMNRDPVFKAYIDQWLRIRKNDGTYKRVFDDALRKISINAKHIKN